MFRREKRTFILFGRIIRGSCAANGMNKEFRRETEAWNHLF
ncbi:hypothetical protein ACQCVP_08535 [Rossellomorea vietnamensis]